MKRIAFLGRGVHTIPTYRLMLNRLSRNFEVTVFCETPIEASWRSHDHNYKLVSTCFRFLPFRINAILFFISVAWHQLIRRYAIIHAHSTYPTGLTAVILQRIFGVKTVVSLDGGEGIYISDVAFGDLNSDRRRKLNKWVLRNATFVNTLTNFHRTMVVRNLKLSREISVIPRGVDENQFAITNRHDLQKPVRFISVGYLSPIKDPVMLLETFQIILKKTPSTLTIVGRDYMNGEIQRLANALGIDRHVQFLGQVAYERMGSIYENADILLHTSRYESQGMAVAEAMAAGVLVCGAHVGLINDLGDQYSVSAPVGDAETLAGKIIQLISDPGRMRALRKNAYAWSGRFSLEKTARHWSEIYTSLIEKQK